MTVQCNINNKVEVDMHIGKVAVTHSDFMMSILILFLFLFTIHALENSPLFRMPWSSNKKSVVSSVQKWMMGINFRMLMMLVELVLLILIICAYDQSAHLSKNLKPLMIQENNEIAIS